MTFCRQEAFNRVLEREIESDQNEVEVDDEVFFHTNFWKKGFAIHRMQFFVEILHEKVTEQMYF